MPDRDITVVPLTDIVTKKSEYMKVMSLGGRGKATLIEVHNAWFAYRSLWEDDFSKELIEYGSYETWKEKFRSDV
jgi:hypothetical protein